MSLVVRVFAPVGRDAELIVELLVKNKLAAEACLDLRTLLSSLGSQPIGPLLIAEEALNAEFIRLLAAVLKRQPAWSDLPILVLTSSGRENSQSIQFERDRLPLGSPVLLERPIRTSTLLSSVQAAVRARERQYQVRDALVALDQAMADLKKERETLRGILENLPVGVIVANAAGEMVLANPSVEAILRHSVEPSQNFASGDWNIFHPDGRRLTGEEHPLSRAIKRGQTIPAEDYLYQRGDGSLGWIQFVAAPVKNADNRITGGVVAIADIDQQKRISEAQARSEIRFRRLIENASIGVNIGSYSGGISYMNPALLSLLGYTAEEIESGSVRWSDLTPPEYATLDRRAMEQLRTTGTAEPYEKQYRAKDGRLLPFLFGATVIPSPENSSEGEEIAVFLTDLSIQKQAETALVESEKIAVVGRLAASISHEINNPLEAVVNLLYIARRNTSLEQIHQCLDQADMELARVSQIVTQTLQFHRQSTRPSSVLPDKLIDSALTLFRGRLANFGVTLIRQNRGVGQIVCYEGDIRQVLNNLVGNAIDAMRNGGRLILRASNSHLWRSGVPGVRLTIADSGHGMEPEVLKRIFRPFYTTKGNNGTGLGLWISQGIVEKHGGILQVKSTTRKGRSGTVFSFFVPVAIELATEQAVASAPVQERKAS